MFLVEGWFDGGYKSDSQGRQHGAVGALIKLNRIPVWSLSEYLGDDDEWQCPDVSETTAAIRLLRQIEKNYARQEGRVIIRGDSLNIINAMRAGGEQSTGINENAARMIELAEREINKIRRFCEISFYWVGREYNRQADGYVKKAFDDAGVYSIA